MMDTYKGIAAVQIGDGTTIQFWHVSINEMPIKMKYPELFSFAKKRQHRSLASYIGRKFL